MQNKLNLELKYFCEDFTPIRIVLKKIGAKKIGMFDQKDYFFNLPSSNKKISPRLKLRIQNNSQTLVYYERSNFEESRANPAKVTLHQVKERGLLGFLKKVLGVKAVVVKKRELWRKNNCIFNLDTVKGIGKIFEIELTTDKKNLKNDEAAFYNFKKEFILYLKDIVRGSNLDLILKS